MALDNRTAIGQAVWLLMTEYKLTSVRAFDVLERLSSQDNRRLAMVAHDLVKLHDENPSRRPQM